ncbi:hypothetical protein DPMN_035319 [Dreissena polymorpha]|uniref:Uncharacterized protein n=1 Tax=Dreissena polymorpha TaxID=45954 RepID=A0A9D4M9F8_DREPO|nr:hypothetical protein DPMN_035319 [Dreissena polymorpha]
MNLLTKFHEDQTINVASREKNSPPLGSHVFQANTINVASIVKNAPLPGSHVFQPTGIIYELFQDIIEMNLLTKFHEYRTINVASREKNAPPLGSHVFQANTNLLTKFHEDRKINLASKVKNAPPPGGHVFQPTGITFELEKCPAPWQPCSSSKHIVETNLLTKFHEDWTINVASRE